MPSLEQCRPVLSHAGQAYETFTTLAVMPAPLAPRITVPIGLNVYPTQDAARLVKKLDIHISAAKNISAGWSEEVQRDVNAQVALAFAVGTKNIEPAKAH